MLKRCIVFFVIFPSKVLKFGKAHVRLSEREGEHSTSMQDPRKARGSHPEISYELFLKE